MREHDSFEASGVLPAWEQQRAVLDAERLSLHAQALTLDADSEAGDLLELLAGQHVDREAVQVNGLTAAATTSAEIRACVEDEHGHVTFTGGADAEAEFFTLYELDDDGLPQARQLARLGDLLDEVVRRLHLLRRDVELVGAASSVSSSSGPVLGRHRSPDTRVLRRNGRCGVTEVVRAVGLSPAPVSRRIKRMEASGVIYGYTALIDDAQSGSLEAFTEVRLGATERCAH